MIEEKNEVLAERERCANIALDFVKRADSELEFVAHSPAATAYRAGVLIGWRDTALQIERLIRSR